MRLGIFGGTFDPPHLGHVLACLWAVETGEVDRVLMAPVRNHAFGKAPSANFAQRVEMCELATERIRNLVEVSDVEDREGANYMVETLEIIARERAGDSLRLIVGSDVAQQLHKWKEGIRIPELAPVLELPRLLDGQLASEKPGALPAVSSTQVREALATEQGVQNLLSRSVYDYIRLHRLYQ